VRKRNWFELLLLLSLRNLFAVPSFYLSDHVLFVAISLCLELGVTVAEDELEILENE
jgi:hypothetical protein